MLWWGWKVLNDTKFDMSDLWKRRSGKQHLAIFINRNSKKACCPPPSSLVHHYYTQTLKREIILIVAANLTRGYLFRCRGG